MSGLRPTRQRMALGWILFAKGDRHLTAEMLYEEATARQGAGVAGDGLQHAAPVHRGRPAAPGRGRRLEDLFRHQRRPSITISSSRARTSWSTFRRATWSSARRRPRRRATRSPASTWSSGCAASGIRDPQALTQFRPARRAFILSCAGAGTRVGLPRGRSAKRALLDLLVRIDAPQPLLHDPAVETPCR